MYCHRCGQELPSSARYCLQCGGQVGFTNTPRGARHLQRPRAGRKIAGVCAGFAEYLNADVTIVRIIWSCTILIGLAGVIAYAVAWVLMPEEPVIAFQPSAVAPGPRLDARG
jgi:phage shock protein C